MNTTTVFLCFVISSSFALGQSASHQHSEIDFIALNGFKVEVLTSGMENNVSHSFGGAFIRSYASQYPDEIAGLVFVDPVDFTKKKGFGDLPYIEIGLTQHQIDSLFGEAYEKIFGDS